MGRPAIRSGERSRLRRCGLRRRRAQAISYAKALLVLNERVLNQRLSIRYAHALAISGSSLTERIRRVLHPSFKRSRKCRDFSILAAMIALAGLATIRIEAADDSPVSERSARKEASQEQGVILRRRTITEEYEKAESAKVPPYRSWQTEASRKSRRF